jgi:ubiquinone/menaquinone biosynthesis C-methylase UbiE
MSSTDIQKQHAIDTHSAQAGEFAAAYDTFAGDAYRECFTYSRKRLEVLLTKYLPERGEGRRLLDVGCGTGHYMAGLAGRGYEVAGVDGSAEMLAHARANNPGAVIEQADVEQLPFADASFDYVLCVEVLRYLPDASACVREIGRVLKPGGVALVTATPRFNANGYWLVNRLAGVLPVKDLVKLKQFFTTSGELRRQFRAAGFGAPSIHGVYTGPINWVERIAPKALPGVLRAWEPADAALADAPLVRELANMFLVKAVRAP